MTKTDDLMALAEKYQCSESPLKSARELRTAIEHALLQAHKAGFDAALLPGSVPDAQPEFCCESAWRDAKALAWKQRDLNCGCDHNEYCGKCFPLDFRKGGKWDKYTHPPAPTTPQPARKIGGSYQADGYIVSRFTTTAGAERVVFEFNEPKGMLHIFTPEQIEVKP